MYLLVASALRAMDATPAPLPTMEVDPELVTPGPYGFLVFALLGLAVVFLAYDMLRRIRRARFRDEINEQLDAEQAALVAASDLDAAEPIVEVMEEQLDAEEGRDSRA